MGKNSNKSKRVHQENHSIREELDKYFTYWPWFVLALVLALVGGYFYLRYTTPTYMASASIIINEEKGNTGGQIAAYGDLGGLNGLGTSGMDKELAILNSRRIMEDVVKALDLHIQYFQEGKVRDVEIYDDKMPFLVKTLKIDQEKLKNSGGGKFAIVPVGNEKFNITNLKTEKSLLVEAGKPVQLDFSDIVIVPNGSIDKSSKVIVQFSTIERTTSRFRGKVVLKQAEGKSNVVMLKMEDPVRQKAKDILDQLILEFNRDAIEDKNLIAGNTANFINERLKIINDELEVVESGKEEFKEMNRLTDIKAESQMYMQNASEYNRQRQEIGTQLELTQAMLDYLSTSSHSELLPSNLGIQENGVNQYISDYNNLVLERNRILTASTERNPVVIKLNDRIDQIKGNIVQSLQRSHSNLRIAMDDVSRQSSSIGSRILAVPSQEREYRGIERQQSIKEALYLYLLQKREENSLSLAVTAPKAKIVDRAYSAGGIVSPNSRSVYLGSIILGLFIPFSVIYLRGMMDNKIRRKADVERLAPGISFLGELPKVRKKQLMVTRNDRSVLSEAFRILITNLQYLKINTRDKNGGTSILVTSTVKGEGKTFVAVNLAVSLANTGKKVLLMGLDLRSPKLSIFKEETDQVHGISDFLANDDLCIKSLTARSKLHSNLDILTSGSIPPNPSELLRQERTGQMFTDLESHYDYLIIDSAPSLLVTDTFLISKYADLTLYVVRAGYTEKKLVDFAVDGSRTGSLQNLSLVLTDVDSSNLGYGNKYGYGYGQEKKNFWARNKTLFAGQVTTA